MSISAMSVSPRLRWLGKMSADEFFLSLVRIGKVSPVVFSGHCLL
jgi:hypothetical protein